MLRFKWLIYRMRFAIWRVKARRRLLTAAHRLLRRNVGA
jgi:hypothetical protein